MPFSTGSRHSAPGADTHRPHRPIEPSPAVVAATDLIPMGKVPRKNSTQSLLAKPAEKKTRGKIHLPRRARPLRPPPGRRLVSCPREAPKTRTTAHPARRPQTRGARCSGLPPERGIVVASFTSHLSERNARAPRGKAAFTSHLSGASLIYKWLPSRPTRTSSATCASASRSASAWARAPMGWCGRR